MSSGSKTSSSSEESSTGKRPRGRPTKILTQEEIEKRKQANRLGAKQRYYEKGQIETAKFTKEELYEKFMQERKKCEELQTKLDKLSEILQIHT